MGIIETLTVGVAAAALLAFAAYVFNESKRRPIRKEARIDEHERDPYRNRMRRK